ncbi:MAG: hypothetical protein KZQ77_16900 [Candidatus Thiodiazotropha sp. (ex Notomyrtea botanica)]|nr:hypothetical protein [Candidatus Thiodiazotropha sp. (ex Notomyrtea botanica)]
MIHHTEMSQTASAFPGMTVNRGRRWLHLMLNQWLAPKRRERPLWLHLPDRVWRRQSALLMSLHERRQVHHD